MCNRQALYRKFRILHVSDWLFLHGLRVTSKGCEFISKSDITDLLTFEDANSNESTKCHHDKDSGREDGDIGYYGEGNDEEGEIGGEYQFNQGVQKKAKVSLP